MIKKLLSKKYRFEIYLFITFFVISALIAWKTFQVDANGDMKIASKAFSDFAATIPLIRSFSFGSNFPPEYPIFPGSPIRYHFVFFLLVGVLEKIGLRIDFALNLLSSLALTALMAGIYLLGKELFQKKSVGILAVILFLFNSSLSFLEILKDPNINNLSDLLSIDTFPSFGPYDGKIVSAFWNLNIYTNQRHLALGYASVLFLILFFVRTVKHKKKMPLTTSLIIGIIIGFFPFVHLPAFGMMLTASAIFFVLFPNLRKSLFIVELLAGILAIPQFLYMGRSEVDVDLIKIGYLVENLNVYNFIKYWIFNLGLSAILPLVAFIKSSKDQKKVFIVFASFFIIGNVFQFSTDISTNHKFFNLFIIGMNIFSASILISLWESKTRAKLVIPILFILLTLSGLVDLIPIARDGHITVKDYKTSSAVQFIRDNTPKNSVFLNSSYIYNPASVAGREIYAGWPYFTWGAGYNAHKRSAYMQAAFNPTNKKSLCSTLNKEGIDYIETRNPPELIDININHDFFKTNFVRVYNSQNNQISIYSVIASCNKTNKEWK